MPTSEDRPFDVVVYGATGYTGALTAEYLAQHAPADLRWAIAGRSEQKLRALRDRLAATDPALADLPVLVAEATDAAGLRPMVEQARVVATTVGPYLRYGGPLVALCAEAGTDYCDITGEPEFIDRAYVDHHATAQRSGARLVHACGFDSVPHDLGAYFAIQELAAEVGGEITTPVRMRGVVRAGGGVSGGTAHSAVLQFSRARQLKEAYAARRRLESRPTGRSSRAVSTPPRRDKELGYWLLPLPTADPMIVARSGAALPSYGPDFRYSHYAGLKTLRYAVGGTAAVGAMAVASQVRPVRNLLLERLPAQGTGPSEQHRRKAWFTVDFVAETTVGGDPVRVHTRTSGGDAYADTGVMHAEAAMCLALDDNPETAGQAMGDAYLGRLQKAGIRFERVAG